MIDEARLQKREERRHQQNGEKLWPWKDSVIEEENRSWPFISNLKNPDIYKKQ